MNGYWDYIVVRDCAYDGIVKWDRIRATARFDANGVVEDNTGECYNRCDLKPVNRISWTGEER